MISTSHLIKDKIYFIGDHSFIKFAKVSEKLAFLTSDTHGVRNVSFSKNFTNVTNE